MFIRQRATQNELGPTNTSAQSVAVGPVNVVVPPESQEGFILVESSRNLEV